MFGHVSMPHKITHHPENHQYQLQMGKGLPRRFHPGQEIIFNLQPTLEGLLTVGVVFDGAEVVELSADLLRPAPGGMLKKWEALTAGMIIARLTFRHRWFFNAKAVSLHPSAPSGGCFHLQTMLTGVKTRVRR